MQDTQTLQNTQGPVIPYFQGMTPPDPTTPVNNATAGGDTANVFAAFQAMSALVCVHFCVHLVYGLDTVTGILSRGNGPLLP